MPFKGGGQLINDLISGQIKLAFSGLPPVLPHHRTGRLKILAVTTAKRFALLPEIEIVAENGASDYDIEQWISWFGPPGLPDAIVKRLASEIASSIATNELKGIIERSALMLIGGGPAELARIMRVNVERYGRLVRELGVKLE